ncbi:MAG: outer membrane beta-barrel protein [Bacteroidota bacterium]
MDKLVVNIKNSITSAGNTVLEVLQRSPGITVNKQSNTISLVGRQGLLIMINGKIQRIPMEAIVQMFSGMNANNIEKIEIISNPSSKYDAQGDAGIINIITRINPEIGTNGSYSVTAGYGYYEKPAASLNINHRTKKYNLFGDYSFSYNKAWQLFSFDWTNSNQGQSTNTASTRYPLTVIHRASIGGELYISPKTTLGIQVSGFNDKWEMRAQNHSAVGFYGKPFSTIDLVDLEINEWNNFMTNINLRHSFSTDRSLTVDADYLYYDATNPHQYTNDYHFINNDSTSRELIDIRKKTPIRMGVFKADYEQKIGKLKLESGIKGTFSRLSNTVFVESNTNGEWKVNNKFTQDYRMKDDVLAAYTNLFIPVNEKTKVQLGLRTEHTDMKIRNEKDSLIFNLDFWESFPQRFRNTANQQGQCPPVFLWTADHATIVSGHCAFCCLHRSVYIFLR